AEAITRLLKYVDAGSATDSSSHAWKQFKAYFLIALDRTADLEKELRAWIVTDSDPTWRLLLGKLHAERGQLNEAITFFETVERADELSVEEYRSLAKWYQIRNRREDFDRIVPRQYQSTAVSNLWYMVQSLNLDDPTAKKQLPHLVRAVLEKAPDSQEARWWLDAYQQTPDIQVAKGIVDSCLGRTGP